jgi:transposase
MDTTSAPFTMNETERAALEAVAAARPKSQLGRRARTLLTLADLQSEWATAEACGVGLEVVRRWRSIFEADRSLTGPPRYLGGRSRTREQLRPIIKPLLRMSPRRFGYARDRWDPSTLRIHLANREHMWVPPDMLRWLIDEDPGA